MDTEKDYIEEKLIIFGFSEQHIEEQEKLIQATIDATKRALSIANVMCWVAVSERTPENNDLCLCSTEYGYSFRYWKGNHFEGEHVANEAKVTHWMYAPKSPYT